MIKRSDAFRLLAKHRTDEAVVTVMCASQEWPAFSNHPDLDFRGNTGMGMGPLVGLGLALAHPERKVWVLNGDGSQLLALGSLATIAHAAPRNLVLFVLENGLYEVTGGQPIPLAGKLDFAGVARALTFPCTHTFDDLASLADQLPDILAQEGPIFVTLKVVGDGAPRTPLPNEAQEFRRFMRVLNAQAVTV